MLILKARKSTLLIYLFRPRHTNYRSTVPRSEEIEEDRREQIRSPASQRLCSQVSKSPACCIVLIPIGPHRPLDFHYSSSLCATVWLVASLCNGVHLLRSLTVVEHRGRGRKHGGILAQILLGLTCYPKDEILIKEVKTM